IEDITLDRVIVSPAPGEPGKMPFWKGDKPGRPLELGRALGEFTRAIGREAPDRATARLREEFKLDELAARNLVAHVEDERESAARALLLPRRAPGKRTPLWQQRQRSADLLQAASKYPTFPILLEATRECLRDVFDLPALKDVLSDVRARRIRMVPVDTNGASPFAQSLLFS